MTARASFDVAQLPKALRQPQAIMEQPTEAKSFADADRFEEGQIAGPYGPGFVGIGPVLPPPITLRQWVIGTLGTAVLIGAVAGVIMLIQAAL